MPRRATDPTCHPTWSHGTRRPSPRRAGTTCANRASWSTNSCSLRGEGIALVRTLTQDDLARSGIHPDVGPLRVDELLGEWVHHDRNHVRQLLAVTQARVWGQMGNARRFSLGRGLTALNRLPRAGPDLVAGLRPRPPRRRRRRRGRPPSR